MRRTSTAINARHDRCQCPVNVLGHSAWSELKRALLDLLVPTNAIQEAVTIFLSLPQQPSEAALEYNIRFRSAIARFESAVERAGPNRPPIVALYVSHYESTVKPSLQCLQYTQNPAVSLKQAMDKTRRHEAAGISSNISALSFTKNTTASADVRQSRPRSKDSRSKRSKRDRERRGPRPRESRSGEPRPRCEHPTCRKRDGHTTEDCFIRKREAADAARHRKNSQESTPAPSSSSRNRRRIDSDFE